MNKYIRKKIQGRKVIGSGRRRIVYDLGNGFVLKVATSKYGIIVNKREGKMYESVPSRIRIYLAQIKKFGKGWIIMKKYVQQVPKSQSYKRKVLNMKSTLRKNGIIPDDVSRRNIRLKPNGQIVVIDYGNFKFKNKGVNEGQGTIQT
jgi:tRNA A-37 threonylcarbamoyl transferase component Bud32